MAAVALQTFQHVPNTYNPHDADGLDRLMLKVVFFLT